MTAEEAARIICANKNGEPGSLIWSMHEKAVFPPEAFRQLCGSIEALRRMPGYTVEISTIYQHILRLLICHFDPADRYEIQNLPADYNDCIDTLGALVQAYCNKGTN